MHLIWKCQTKRKKVENRSDVVIRRGRNELVSPHLGAYCTTEEHYAVDIRQVTCLSRSTSRPRSMRKVHAGL